MNEDKKVDEKELEKVTGGKVLFSKPVYDPDSKEYTCPVCGHVIINNGINSYRVQCPDPACGRWFQIVGNTLVAE